MSRRTRFPKTARGAVSALERSDRATSYAWAQFYDEREELEKQNKALSLTRSVLLDTVRSKKDLESRVRFGDTQGRLLMHSIARQRELERELGAAKTLGRELAARLNAARR